MRVTTDQRTYLANEVVVAAGAWSPGLLGGRYAERLQLHRQVMFWFAPAQPAVFAPDRFPTFIWMHGQTPQGWFYGFPVLPGSAGVKVASEQFESPLVRPEDIERTVSAVEIADMHRRHVSGRLPGITSTAVGARACLYTMAPESRFIIGRDPDRQRIVVVSACSGHGFKHSAAIGEAVAQLIADSAPPAMLDPFGPDLAN